MTEELDQLKSNADELAQNLQNLMQKIQTVESNTPSSKKNKRKRNKKNGIANGTKESQPLISSSPEINIVKTTVVKERVLSTQKFSSLALDGPAPSISLMQKTTTLTPNKYEARSVDIDAELLKKITVERIGTKLIIKKVGEEARKVLNPGDTILQVGDKYVYLMGDLENLKGPLKLLIEPAPVYHAPSLFYRVRPDEASSKDSGIETGDVVQVLCSDADGLQVRKLDDLTQVGYLPADTKYERVSLMCPFGRKVLVLLGVAGVGRRSIKDLLIRTAPQFFATVVPVTSRDRRPGERDGREYEFIRKDEAQDKIRNGGMVEWGELDNHIYGTSTESVKEVIRSGRMCVLDCSPQALENIYNANFMPYVVHIAPPPEEEFIELEQLRMNKKSPEDIHRICKENAILEEKIASRTHLKLVNRNIEITFKRLLDSLETLRYDSQWVPEDWLC